MPYFNHLATQTLSLRSKSSGPACIPVFGLFELRALALERLRGGALLSVANIGSRCTISDGRASPVVLGSPALARMTPRVAMTAVPGGSKISARIAHFALDFLRKESVCVRSQAPSLTGFPSRPRQRRWASAGFGW